MKNLRRHVCLLGAIVSIGLSSLPSAAEARGIAIAAAMSLRAVLPTMVEAFREQSSAGAITVTYGASGMLRRQVEAGAPIDVIVLAGPNHVDQLIESGDVVAGTRRVVATNALLLIGPIGSGPLAFATIDAVPSGELIAIGDPNSVPAGRYAREAFRSLGVWDAIRDRLVYGGHVAAVLQYARRAEVAAAVVYATDARGVDDIVVLDRASGAWAPKIETVGAAVRGSHETTARAFLEFLASPTGQQIFVAHGFGATTAPSTVAAP